MPCPSHARLGKALTNTRSKTRVPEALSPLPNGCSNVCSADAGNYHNATQKPPWGRLHSLRPYAFRGPATWHGTLGAAGFKDHLRTAQCAPNY